MYEHRGKVTNKSVQLHHEKKQKRQQKTKKTTETKKTETVSFMN